MKPVQALAPGDELHCPHCHRWHTLTLNIGNIRSTDYSDAMLFFKCSKGSYYAGEIGGSSRFPTRRNMQRGDIFTAGMLLVSSWADLLHVRQLAVGSAAINTLWQIGAFLSPYAWGVTKDATGSFRAGLIGASVVAAVEALVILYVRTRAMSERRERAAAIEQPLAVPL